MAVDPLIFFPLPSPETRIHPLSLDNNCVPTFSFFILIYHSLTVHLHSFLFTPIPQLLRTKKLNNYDLIHFCNTWSVYFHQKTTTMGLALEFDANNLQTIKLGVHIGQAVLIFVSWALEIAVFHNAASIDGRPGWYFGLVRCVQPYPLPPKISNNFSINFCNNGIIC